MTAPKLIIAHGVLGKVEASYGAGGALNAADHAILTETRVEARRQFAHDGTLEPEAGRGFNWPKGAPAGPFIEFALPVVARGLGSTYGAAAFPTDLHTAMRISGHAANLNVDEWEYIPVVPEPENFVSGVFELYERHQKWPVTGAYGSMEFTIDGPGFMRFAFQIMGIAGAPSEAAIFSAGNYDTILHPKAINVALDIGGYTPAKVRRIVFRQGRDMTPRLDVNSGGHAGFSPGGVFPEMDIDIEAVDLAALNPYTWNANAESKQISFAVGAAGNDNRIEFEALQCKLREEPQEPTDGNTAIWTLPVRCEPSSVGVTDSYKITLAA